VQAWQPGFGFNRSNVARRQLNLVILGTIANVLPNQARGE